MKDTNKTPPSRRARGNSHDTENQHYCDRSFGVCLRGWPVGDIRAQDCPRGDLDKGYCDRNGDLVADTPAQTVNPPTLVFAYTPVEDPALYTKVWDGFLRHLEKVTGKKVVFFPVQSNAAEIEAMRSGRLHIAGVSTGPTPIAVNCAGYVPFAIMGSQDGRFGYEMEIIVPADSPIKTPADIKGKKLAFTAPTSNSGFKAPSVLAGVGIQSRCKARL